VTELAGVAQGDLVFPVVRVSPAATSPFQAITSPRNTALASLSSHNQLPSQPEHLDDVPRPARVEADTGNVRKIGFRATENESNVESELVRISPLQPQRSLAPTVIGKASGRELYGTFSVSFSSQRERAESGNGSTRDSQAGRACDRQHACSSARNGAVWLRVRVATNLATVARSRDEA
jgi:hypothetical protein